MSPVSEHIRDFVIAECGWFGTREELTDDLPLTMSLDSLALVKIVAMVEEEFGVEVRDDDIVLENFGTIAGITRFVAERR
jgi:acyl carrier protein